MPNFPISRPPEALEGEPLPPAPAGVVVVRPPSDLVGASPSAVARWFDDAVDGQIPEADGTLETARRIAEAVARHAKADNTRRAYRAGVRAWCAFCGDHGLTPLPARPADIAGFLADQRLPTPPRQPVAGNTLRLRLAAIAYLHHVVGLPSPTTAATVTETLAGLDRLAKQAGQGPKPKAAAKVDILREMLRPIGEDLPGLRDRALLLLGFAGAFRRSELAGIAVEHLEQSEHGLRITLPFSKGDRDMKGVVVAIPYGSSALCPVRALQRWMAAAGITEGPVFRRIWATPRPEAAPETWLPIHIVGRQPLSDRSIARIVQARGAAAGFDGQAFGGHSLKRGAMNTAKDRRVHPAQLKQLGRHKSYATLAAYIEEGDLFEGNALNGVL